MRAGGAMATAAIEFHCAATANNFKIAIALEELGLPYRLVRYDMLSGQHLTPEFRRISPNSKVPAIVDPEPAFGGGPFAVFESGAILLYLAEKTGKLLPLDPRRRAVALQWLVWQVAGLGPMHGQAHHFHRFAPADQAYGRERYTREARRLMQVLQNRLAEGDWLTGEFCIADIACYPQVLRTALIGFGLDDYPVVRDWAARIGERPAVRRAAAALMDEERPYYKDRRADLAPEQWSALFGDRFHAAAKDGGGT